MNFITLLNTKYEVIGYRDLLKKNSLKIVLLDTWMYYHALWGFFFLDYF